ncbi:MAG: hypothetical protein SFX74_04520 [Fimbriimonadaceae bacterium]|nr:hypothetical protein [Fimbriimonadaceae bacterium]
MSVRPVIPNLWHHPGIHDYNLGAKHPLKPSRLRRLYELLGRIADLDLRTAQLADDDDIWRVHTPDYWSEVCAIDACLRRGQTAGLVERRQAIDLKGDTPAFAGMEAACRAYVGATVDAARCVAGGANLAFAMGGGLHHAMPGCARGFCILNDPAIAVSILRDRFERVLYVDLDVHHGDGVETIFRSDRQVLTYSVHEDPSTLWPRTGHAHEIGPVGTCANVPLPAGTTGEDWAFAIRETLGPLVDWFRPRAMVVQCGADVHALDPLAHLAGDIPSYVSGIEELRRLRLPTVVVGGGGYHLAVTPVTWASVVLTFTGHDTPGQLPADLAAEWEWPDWNGPIGRGFDETNCARDPDVRARVERFHSEILPAMRHRYDAGV